MSLKDRIFDELERRISELQKELEDRRKMREKLKSMDESSLNDYLGMVKWYYTEKTRNTKNG